MIKTFFSFHSAKNNTIDQFEKFDDYKNQVEILDESLVKSIKK